MRACPQATWAPPSPPPPLPSPLLWGWEGEWGKGGFRKLREAQGGGRQEAWGEGGVETRGRGRVGGACGGWKLGLQVGGRYLGGASLVCAPSRAALPPDVHRAPPQAGDPHPATLRSKGMPSGTHHLQGALRVALGLAEFPGEMRGPHLGLELPRAGLPRARGAVGGRWPC